MAELAAASPQATLKAEQVSRSQDVPLKFLLNILVELKHAGFLQSHRGIDGGYSLAMPAGAISIADVIRAVEGPLATVQETRPENLRYSGAAARLQDVWIAVRSSLRSVLEEVTLDDLVRGTLPSTVSEMAALPDAWASGAARMRSRLEAVDRKRRSRMSRSASGRQPHVQSRARR